jgi:hypothetical protein
MLHRAQYFHEHDNKSIYVSVFVTYFLCHSYLNAIIDWKSEVEAILGGWVGITASIQITNLTLLIVMREEKDNSFNRDYASSFHGCFQRLAICVEIGLTHF